MNPITLFLLVLRSSLLSTGGFGNVPALHTDLVGGGLTSDATFAESMAVGQISPGPNGLWVISLGYLLGGWFGAAAATLAIVLPPFLVLIVDRMYNRVQDHPAVEGLMRGLSLAVVGVFLVAMARLASSFRHDSWAVIAAVVACGLGLTKRVPVLAVIGVAAALGIVFGKWR